MIRNLILMICVGLAACSATGCGSSPCKHIDKANWKCNLNVTGQYRPGDLIYVEKTRDGKRETLLPEKAGGYELDSRDATVADVIGNSNWSFDIGVAAGEFPGLSSVSDVKGKLKASGFKKMNFVFTETKIVSLKVGAETVPTKGAELLDKATIVAQEYVKRLTPPNKNGIRTATGNHATVWLVMQVIDSKVKGELQSGGSVGVDAAATVKGIGVDAGLDSDTSTTFSLQTKNAQMIALRAIPLVVEGEEIGPMGAVQIQVRNDARLGAPE